MSLVHAHTEWDPLEEMIVGIANGARIPSPDPGLYAVDYAGVHDNPSEIPSGPYSQATIDEANEDLAGLVRVLEQNGVTVRRPDPTDHSRHFGTPDWQADGEYNYCPRDVLLVVGDMVIETPMTLRTRYFEPFAYRSILLEYFRSGARWISAPKPRLLDGTWKVRPERGSILNDVEPIFDAANVIRIGRDILYLVSCSGNHLGLEWLRRSLGPEYRVHAIEGVYEGTHIDSTITLVRPGLVVLNPARVRKEQVPEIFKNWDIIWCPELVDSEHSGNDPRGSIWQGMNFIMINPYLAVIDEKQVALIREIERHGVDVAALPMRHARKLSGGFHCVTVDVRRRGNLEDYR